ncbi:hypothetical protein EVAR_36833_1 [Eumeta japonica]|uniref:Androglobin domain-containing protein n=1 Tax=Eumeta variegata TaxID=151549 RepID=A0A4C1WD41_EUMVA|nr:hypothetical protein EVAR_36833_1 [Eumeta japonica]
MFPGVRSAYSISTALRCAYFQRHTGPSTVTSKSRWVPFFQEVFFCHVAVRVHLDLDCSLQQRTVTIYDNDTRTPVIRTFNAHRSYEVSPNLHGYAVIGHGWMDNINDNNKNVEVQWRLSVLSPLENVFHICEYENFAACRGPLQMQSASKFHLRELFIPNRRNILGGMQVTVSRKEYLVFRATASSSDLQMTAKLWSFNEKGEAVILDECTGVGEIYWPYLSLESSTTHKRSVSMININHARGVALGGSATTQAEDSSSVGVPSLIDESEWYPRQGKRKRRRPQKRRGDDIRRVAGVTWKRVAQYRREWKRPWLLQTRREAEDDCKSRGGQPLLKIWCRLRWTNRPQTGCLDAMKRDSPGEEWTINPRVTAPDGWPLTLDQWKRVGRESSADSGPPTRKDRSSPLYNADVVNEADAFVDLEVSLSVRNGAVAKRDDARDLAFVEAQRSWDVEKTGRNVTGANFRRSYRNTQIVTSTKTLGVLKLPTDVLPATSYDLQSFKCMPFLRRSEFRAEHLVNVSTTPSLRNDEEGLMMELSNFQLRYQILKANHGQSVFHENINKSKHG